MNIQNVSSNDQKAKCIKQTLNARGGPRAARQTSAGAGPAQLSAVSRAAISHVINSWRVAGSLLWLRGCAVCTSSNSCTLHSHAARARRRRRRRADLLTHWAATSKQCVQPSTSCSNKHTHSALGRPPLSWSVTTSRV